MSNQVPEKGEDKVAEAYTAVSKFVATLGDETDNAHPKSTFHQAKIELTRLGFFIAVTAIAFFFLPHETAAMMIMLGQVALVCLATHLFRKFLMSYVNMEDLYDRMKRGNIAAAIGFCAMCAIIIALLVVISTALLTSTTAERLIPIPVEASVSK